MPTTPNRGWVYPTEWQNPYFETIEDFFLAQDADVLAKQMVDAKGDLLVATAADTVTRLAVGTNGQILTADSSQATGITWGRAPYRISMLSAATTIVNTIAATACSKVLTLPAGVLAVVGAQVHVYARVATACGPGASTIVYDLILGGTSRVGYIAVTLPTGDVQHSIHMHGVIRTIGVSGLFVGGPSFAGPGGSTDIRTGATFAPETSVNTTAAQNLVMNITLGQANATTSATLESFFCEVTYPDVTVA
jgi:hypothetical protein